jgi:TetR/AcrR family transcriptional regulator, cholesterol catabolism regulator
MGVSVERDARWEARRRSIVDTAARLFAERGYHATGTAELCDAVGLGKGSFYYYVESKQNLLSLIHERVMTDVLEFAEEIVAADESATRRLLRLGREQLAIMTRFPAHVAVFLHEHKALTGEPARRLTENRREYERIVERILQDGVDGGEFEIEDVHLAALGWLGMHNYAYIWYRPDSVYSPDEISAEFFALFVRGATRR